RPLLMFPTRRSSDLRADALLIAEEQDPDLIILDLHMQGMDGLETLTKLRDAGVTSRIVMLTVSDSDEDVLAAISQGADGYLLKDTDPDQLLEQIKLALSGKMVLSEAVTQVLAAAIRRPAVRPASELDSLTGREVEILQCIVSGMTDRGIARELDIADGMVKVDVKHLLKKLGLRSRVERAVWMVNQQREGKA